MFLEITHGSEAAVTYPLKDRLLIGSSSPSDIVLPVAGLSRKHVLLMRDNDKYFVIDQGSTNGTYVDEERIRPGDRVEISFFLPIRLSRDVVMSLVKERESKIGNSGIPQMNRLNEDATSVISLKELSEARVPEKARARLARHTQKVPAKKFDLSQALNIIIFTLLCIVFYLAIRKKA